MITKKVAEWLGRGCVLYHKTLTNADGTPRRCRVIGKCKTWQTREGWQLPVKRGLYEFGYITADNAGEWRLAA
jgi:hypothetical protein